MHSGSEAKRAASHGDDYTPGEVLLGKYQLIQLLAVGGMGAVWRAHNQLLDSDVAVKLMFQATTDPGGAGLKRAHSEARLAAQLNHPAVCRVLDFGVSEYGHPFVVNELLQGVGLEERLDTKGPLSAIEAAQLMPPVLDGLGAAHKKGIVHRDVKPSNIFLANDEDGNVRPTLLDFGIARGLAEEQRITVTGVVCGTPAYMSPEQARGSKDVDLRSDLWSVCATLYELVTDRAPFGADNYNAVMFEVIHQPHTPLSELPEQDRPFVAIIDRGLSKDREARFQSASDLARQLAIFLLARGIDVDACGHSLRSRLSMSELKLSVEQLASLQAPLARQTPYAPTLVRLASPRLTGASAESVDPPRSSRRGLGARRWLIAALGGASLLALGVTSFGSPRASSSQHAAKPVAARGAVEPEREASQPSEPSPSLVVAPRPSDTKPNDAATGNRSMLVAAAQGASVASAQTARRASAPPSTSASVESAAPQVAVPAPSAPAVDNTTASKRAAQAPSAISAKKPNALGFDFGL